MNQTKSNILWISKSLSKWINKILNNIFRNDLKNSFLEKVMGLCEQVYIRELSIEFCDDSQDEKDITISG